MSPAIGRLGLGVEFIDVVALAQAGKHELSDLLERNIA